jgi:hypothetical protein
MRGVEIQINFFTSTLDGGGQLHAPVALSQEKEHAPRYTLDRKLGGPQSRSERREEKNLSPAGNRTPAVQPVTIPTELPEPHLRIHIEGLLCLLLLLL